MIVKICRLCGNLKEHYIRSESGKPFSQCIECDNERSRVYKRQHGNCSSVVYILAHNGSRDSIKAYAQNAVMRALHDGMLVRPVECTRCGMAAKVVAHHSDYSKPLEVEWLCRRCHGEIHSGRYVGCNSR